MYFVLSNPMALSGTVPSSLQDLFRLRSVSLPPNHHPVLLEVQYQVAPTPDVMFHFGISRKDLKSIPIIYPLPGEWVQQRMVDVAQARALGLRKHRSLEKMKQGFRARLQERREKEELAWSKWDEDVDRGSQRQAPRYRNIPTSLIKGFDPSDWRLMGTTWFPYWDRHRRVLEPGVYCQACTYRYEE